MECAARLWKYFEQVSFMGCLKAHKILDLPSVNMDFFTKSESRCGTNPVNGFEEFKLEC